MTARPVDGDARRRAWAARVASVSSAGRGRRSKPRRPRWKKVLLPALLVFIGLACTAAAVHVYPRRAPVEVPGAVVTITGSSRYVNNHMQAIDYYVLPVLGRPGVTRVEVDVYLDTRIPRDAYRTARAKIVFYPGAWVLGCSPHCRSTYPDKVGDAWPRFQQPGAGVIGPPIATAFFYVQAGSYEVAGRVPRGGLHRHPPGGRDT